MLVGALLVHACSRDRGCSAHPAFPAPSELEEGGTKWKTSGKSCRENAKACLPPAAVIARLDRATKFPETPMIEPRSRGVLDHPPSRVMAVEDVALSSFPAPAGYRFPASAKRIPQL